MQTSHIAVIPISGVKKTPKVDVSEERAQLTTVLLHHGKQGALIWNQFLLLDPGKIVEALPFILPEQKHLDNRDCLLV